MKTIFYDENDGGLYALHVEEGKVRFYELKALRREEAGMTSIEVPINNGYAGQLAGVVPFNDESFAKDGGESKKPRGGGGTSKKGEKTCSKCGEPGHNAKTCGRALEVEQDIGKQTAAWKAHKEAKDRADRKVRVKRMVVAGMGFEEVKAGLKDPKLSDREIEELIAWAEHE